MKSVLNGECFSVLGARSDSPGRDEVIEILSGSLSANVKEAWLFGSFARGDQRELSDVDLLLVAESTRPFVQRFKDYDELFERIPGLELLVYLPEEFESLKASPTTPFWREFNKDAVRVTIP